MGSKWVLKIKENVDRSIKWYKACIVTQGFSQKLHLDYTETFAPVTQFASLHTILTISAIEDLEVHHMDVSSTFLNGDLEEDICPARGVCETREGTVSLLPQEIAVWPQTESSPMVPEAA